DDAGPRGHRGHPRADGLDDVPPPHRLSRLRVQPREAAPQDLGDARGGARAGPLDRPPRRLAMTIEVSSRVSASPSPRRVRALLERAARLVPQSRTRNPKSKM